MGTATTCPRCGWAGGVKPRRAADLLGVSHQTVRNMIRDGTLPGVETEARPGGYNYWIPVEVLERRTSDGAVEPDPASVRNCPRCGRRSALTPLEAARELGVAESTVRNYIAAEKLEAQTEPTSGGFRYWIDVSEVERFKEAAGAVA